MTALKGLTRRQRSPYHGARMQRSAPVISAVFVEYLKQAAIAGVLVAAVTTASLLVNSLIGYRSVGILYLLTISCISLFLSTPVVVFSTLLSAVLWIYFFIPPRFSILGASFEDTLMFAMYFITAFVTGILTSRLKAGERKLTQREARMEFFHDFATALSEVRDEEKIARMSVGRISAHFQGSAVLFLRGVEGELSPLPTWPQPEVGAEDFRAAALCFSGRVPSGRHTGTLPESGFHFIPLVTPDAVVGVLGISLLDWDAWTPEMESSLATVAHALSISLEREALHREHQKSLVEMESERLGRILLNTVSHEMRTPLTAIKGAVTSLLDEGEAAGPPLRAALLSEVLDASDTLNGIVENLLSMNRLESGHLKLKRSTVDIEELASVVCDSVRGEPSPHPLSVKGETTGFAVSVDFVLMAQALSNVLQNAFRHTPDGTPVEMSVGRDGSSLLVEISDSGPGVSAPDLPRLFEKFYRCEKTHGGGTGLGLTICAGIVHAHEGEVTAARASSGGLAVRVQVPRCVVREP